MLPLLNGAASLLLFLLSATTLIEESSSEGRVVCYYTNWSVYRPGTAKYNPQNINPYLCTHLIYAFGGFTKDNQMKPFDKYQDVEQGGYAKFTGLKTYNKQLKTMIAIGGWNEASTRFSPLVANPERRQQFIKNVLKFLRQNHFDGIDLDWEYPAHREGGKAHDRENYAQFVQEMRAEFERESKKTGRTRLLITMAVPAGIEYIEKGYDIQKLNKYLDWFNLLTYDFHSSHEPSANHHAPLYSLEEESEYNYDSELNIDYSVKFYLKAGADRDKLVLGIPTYGRSYTLINEESTDIGAPAEGPGEQGDATREKGYLAYYEICQNIKEDPEWTIVQPNPNAMGPYAYRRNQWVGYDDEAIVRKKASYVVEHGLGGIMFWAIDNDDFRGTCTGKPYPLIEAAKDEMLSQLGLGINEVSKPGPQKKPVRSRSRDNASSTRNRISDTAEQKSALSRNSQTRNRKTSTTTTTTVAPSSTTIILTEVEGSSLYIGGRTTTPPPPTTPDPGADFKCEEEGFFQHPRDCKKYYWCLDSGPSGLGIVAHMFTCPSGLYFNPAADSCDFARNVPCKTKKSTTAAPLTSPATITSTTARPTETPSPIRNSFFRTSTTARTTTTARPTTAKTTTTTPKEEYEYEYEDSDDEVGTQTKEKDAEEDPKVIKELIELIRKLGGIDELEKHLLRKDDGTIFLKESDALASRISTTPASISKSLYDKVLSRPQTYNSFRNRFASNSLFRKQESAQNQQKEEQNIDKEDIEIAPKSSSEQSKYSSVVRNARPGPQNEGLDKLPEFDALLKEKKQYVTITRNRPKNDDQEEEKVISNRDDEEEEDEEDDVEEDDQIIVKSTPRTINTSRPPYASIRRIRPPTPKSKLLDEEQSAQKTANANTEEQTETRYISLNRRRGTTTTTTERSKYSTVERSRSTKARTESIKLNAEEDVNEDEVIEQQQENKYQLSRSRSRTTTQLSRNENTSDNKQDKVNSIDEDDNNNDDDDASTTIENLNLSTSTTANPRRKTILKYRRRLSEVNKSNDNNLVSNSSDVTDTNLLNTATISTNIQNENNTIDNNNEKQLTNTTLPTKRVRKIIRKIIKHLNQTTDINDIENHRENNNLENAAEENDNDKTSTSRINASKSIKSSTNNTQNTIAEDSIVNKNGSITLKNLLTLRTGLYKKTLENKTEIEQAEIESTSIETTTNTVPNTTLQRKKLIFRRPYTTSRPAAFSTASTARTFTTRPTSKYNRRKLYEARTSAPKNNDEEEEDKEIENYDEYDNEEDNVATEHTSTTTVNTPITKKFLRPRPLFTAQRNNNILRTTTASNKISEEPSLNEEAPEEEEEEVSEDYDEENSNEEENEAEEEQNSADEKPKTIPTLTRINSARRPAFVPRNRPQQQQQQQQNTETQNLKRFGGSRTFNRTRVINRPQDVTNKPTRLRTYERKYTVGTTEISENNNEVSTALLEDLNIEALNARNKKIFDINSKKHTNLKPKLQTQLNKTVQEQQINNTTRLNTEYENDDEYNNNYLDNTPTTPSPLPTTTSTTTTSSTTHVSTATISTDINNDISSQAYDIINTTPQTPTTTLLHIFTLFDDMSTTAKPSSLPPTITADERKSRLLSEDPKHKVVEINRIVEITSKEDKLRRKSKKHPEILEPIGTSSLKVVSLPHLEQLGEISVVKFVHLVDGSDIEIDGHSTVADYTPTEPSVAKASAPVRNSVPIGYPNYAQAYATESSRAYNSLTERYGKALVPEVIREAVETSTIPLEGLFDRETRKAKQLDGYEEEEEEEGVVLGVTEFKKDDDEYVTITTTSKPTTTTTNIENPTTTRFPKYVRPLVPLLRPESNESSPIVISIANLDQVILSKVNKSVMELHTNDTNETLTTDSTAFTTLNNNNTLISTDADKTPTPIPIT